MRVKAGCKWMLMEETKVPFYTISDHLHVCNVLDAVAVLALELVLAFSACLSSSARMRRDSRRHWLRQIGTGPSQVQTQVQSKASLFLSATLRLFPSAALQLTKELHAGNSGTGAPGPGAEAGLGGCSGLVQRCPVGVPILTSATH